jgi:hypothetical protein
LRLTAARLFRRLYYFSRIMAKCPHCRQSIDPPPKRSRKCPHCREPIALRRGQLLTPEAAETLDNELTAMEAKKRLREGRQKAAREIREARKSGVVTGFTPLVSGNDCDVCQAASDRFFPIATCTPEMLPPYENCELPEGCRATFTCRLSQEYEYLLAKNPPKTLLDSGPTKSSKPGCLTALVAVCAFVVIWVTIAKLSWSTPSPAAELVDQIEAIEREQIPG